MDTTSAPIASATPSSAAPIPTISPLAAFTSERAANEARGIGIDLEGLSDEQVAVATRVAREVAYDPEGDVAILWSPTQLTLNGSYSLGQLRALAAVMEAVQGVGNEPA